MLGLGHFTRTTQTIGGRTCSSCTRYSWQ